MNNKYLRGPIPLEYLIERGNIQGTDVDRLEGRRKGAQIYERVANFAVCEKQGGGILGLCCNKN